MRRMGPVIAALACVAVLAGCGGDDAGNDSGAAAPDTSTTLPAEPTATSHADSTTTTVTASGYATGPFTFNTEAGWTYSVTFDLRGSEVVWTKDVTMSPPGSARLAVSSSTGDEFGIAVAGATPGRTAPHLQPTRPQMYFPVPGEFPCDVVPRDPFCSSGFNPLSWEVSPGVYPEPVQAGSCSEIATPSVDLADFATVGDELMGSFKCYLGELDGPPPVWVAQRDPVMGASADLPEAYVDALLDVLLPQGSQAVIAVGLGHCGMLLYPDGSFVQSEKMKTGAC